LGNSCCRLRSLLSSNTKLRLELSRNSDIFCLNHYTAAPNAGRTYSLEVRDMKWYVNMVDINKTAHLGIEIALREFPAKYPVRRVKMVRLNVSQGEVQTPHHTLFTGQIPRRLIIGCVRRTAFNGSWEHNPFRFYNYGIREVTVTAGGNTYHRDPLRMDFAHNQYFRTFNHFLQSLGLGSPHTETCGITPEKYKSGLCLFGFDLTPDKQDGSHWDLAQRGSTSIEIKFGVDPGAAAGVVAGLQHAIEVIVYAEFDSIIRIDHNREAHLDHMS
jgi:hypothetical protein